MDELAASIAHEVSQPLAAIVTNAESCLAWLAKDRPDVERARRAAERIVRNGQHATNVIRSLRAMLHRTPLQVSPLDFNALAVGALDLMRSELARHHVIVETQLCPLLGVVTGDRTRLQQVIVNLVSNALESMAEGAIWPRHLRVCTGIDADGAARLSISDSGTGIDPATMSRIFEPFFTTKRDGMGLGLSISRSIVESHGGRLWASAREPRGSTFHLCLPARDLCPGVCS